MTILQVLGDLRCAGPGTDPTLYVAVTARSDPRHAPPGHLNLFIAGQHRPNYKIASIAGT